MLQGRRSPFDSPLPTICHNVQTTLLDRCDTEAQRDAVHQLTARVEPLPIDDEVVKGLLAELRVEEDSKAADSGVRLLRLLTRLMPRCIGRGSQTLLVKEVTRLGRAGSSGPLGTFLNINRRANVTRTT